MERRKLIAKRPSRKVAGLQIQAPAEQMEATTPHHGQETSPQQQQEQQAPPQPLKRLPGLPGQPFARPLPPQRQPEHPPAPPPPPQPQSQPQPQPADSAAPHQDGQPADSAAPSSSKGKDAIYVPETPTDLQAQWAKLFVENIQLQSTIRDQESTISHQASSIINLSTESKNLRVTSNQTTPRLASLEMALTSNTSQLSHIQEESSTSTFNLIAAGKDRRAAHREAANLRSLNQRLVTNTTEDRKHIVHLQTLLDRMKLELDAVVEERVRSSVLEAENAKLRSDIAEGMEQMRVLMQSQQEMSVELVAQDSVEAETEWKAKRAALERGEDLGALGIGFRGDSIWEGAEAGEKVEGEIVQVVDRGTQMTPPPPESPVLPPKSPVLPPKSPVLPPKSPVLPPKSPVLPPESSVLPPAAMLDTAAEREFVAAPTPPTSFLPLLLLLLSAFFLALYADRLATEREIWAAANGAVRGLTAGWNGREWWSGVVGEWVEWEVERWSGVERRLLG